MWIYQELIRLGRVALGMGWGPGGPFMKIRLIPERYTQRHKKRGKQVLPRGLK